MSKVNILPGVSVLAVLRHLNYKPWFALGEFVDNSVQSFNQNRAKIESVEGKVTKLCVDIDINTGSPSRISIRDNAAGIFNSEFPRAFRPAVVPPDCTGLSEFGMGMKSAACWFAPTWSVRTSALGEPVSRSVQFDIENIVNDNIEELSIIETEEKAEAHYTEVLLDNVFHVPLGRTVTKLKDHLTDIYRVFIREGLMDLRLNGETLRYREPRILNCPHYKNLEGEAKEWRKPIEFDFGDGLSVHGFAALREKGNTAKAGFSLFRRGRVIQGSGDEGYRPEHVFGRANSYRYQRLFGELHLEGFEVSHTKDGFRWDENEAPFLELLREHLDSGDLPLLKQAEGHRSGRTQTQLKTAAQQAVSRTTQAMQSRLPTVLPTLSDAELVDTPEVASVAKLSLANRQFEIDFRGHAWVIHVELTNDPAESQWLVLSDSRARSSEPRNINIRVSLAHPFMVRFAQSNSEEVEVVLRVAAAIALAEVLARDSGVRSAGSLRRNINDLLREALSEP